ncbi:MAG: hypothetical protein HY254_09470 [Burkholderiales bacterium]|nr:hypothetical protein [Burkholderiales bacterium]
MPTVFQPKAKRNGQAQPLTSVAEASSTVYSEGTSFGNYHYANSPLRRSAALSNPLTAVTGVCQRVPSPEQGRCNLSVPPVQLTAAPIQFGRTKRRIKRINSRGFNKRLKNEIGGTKSGYDISHKVSANLFGILFKRISKNPRKLSRTFARELVRIMDRNALDAKDEVLFDSGASSLLKVAKTKKITEDQKDEIAELFRLFANRNPKNLRNKRAGENRSIGAYPHFNIEDGELSDDGEEIQDTINPQLGRFSDDEYSDDEEQRVAHGYLQLPDNLDEIQETEDQVDYRKVGNGFID